MEGGNIGCFNNPVVLSNLILYNFHYFIIGLYNILYDICEKTL